MRNLKALALGLFIALASFTGAFAQCGTQAPANKFCGNDTVSPALATWKSIPAGALTPIAGGTVLGNPTGALAVPVATTAPVLGIPGTSTGQIGLAGSGSGTAILRAQSAAGSAVSLLPTVAGTLVGSSSAPLVIGAATGTITCPTCVTSSGGGAITGTAPISVSAAGVVSINAPYVALTANNGGIVYSGATNLAILNGTATARQMLQSGAATAPAWSTAVWPATTTINQLLYADVANNVTGLATANGGILNTGATGIPSITATPLLGVAGTTMGTMRLSGSGSGVVTITPQAAAGTVTMTLPNASGTFAVGASGPLVLSATTGGLTCPTCVTSSGGGAVTGTAPIAVSAAGVVSINAPYVSLTASNGGIVYSGSTNLAILNGTATASLPLLSGANAAPTWATVSHPTSANSGGVAYFSSTTVMASSATLTANQLMIGGGAGSPPTTTTAPNIGTATGTSIILGGTDLVPAVTNKVNVSVASSLGVISVGQDSTHALGMIWTFNATPASASAAINTAGYLNPLTIDASILTLQSLSGGSTLVYNGGVAPTGTGAYVLATNASLVTPNLGAATATTINKVTITAPASSATLTIANGKVATINNTLTFSGTDSSSIAFGAGGTIGSVGYAALGQIPGTATNDNATAGNIGEVITGGGEFSSTAFTVTIASPAVVTFPTTTWTRGCLGNGTAAFTPTTTGALPTGMTSGTTVWIICSTVSGSTVQIATSLDNAMAGTAINTTGSQSGTHTASAPAITTTTAIDLAGVRLTAGDWEVNETVYANPSAGTSVTDVSAYITSVANTADTTPGKFAQIQAGAFVPGAGAVVTASVVPYRISLSAIATVRCDAIVIFTISTMTGSCYLKAIRAR